MVRMSEDSKPIKGARGVIRPPFAPLPPVQNRVREVGLAKEKGACLASSKTAESRPVFANIAQLVEQRFRKA